MSFCKKIMPLFALVLVSCSEATSSRVAEAEKPRPVGMVVTANPLATEAGLEILRAGGSATDAAVAIAATLSLVEPQSSGLGGGGFLVHYDATSKKIDYYNGREMAPAGVTKALFFDKDGKKLSRRAAKNSGLSIGAPGAVALLSLAHDDHGKLAWKELFGSALRHSKEGFAVSPRMHRSIAAYGPYFHKDEKNGPTGLYDYLHLDDGSPLPIGHILKNPDYARTLEIIANDPKDFYRGELADAISQAAQEMPNGGSLSVSDINNYFAVKRDAYCSEYRRVTLCGSALPSSWVSVSMVMSILDKAPQFSAGGADDPANWILLAEALRITYADNNQFIADDAFVDVPIEGLMSQSYVKDRAKLVSLDKPIKDLTAGDPWAHQKEQTSHNFGKDATYDDVGTTHFVVVDAEGNAVSMTATVEGYFGSLRMAGGMILNNQLTDFSFEYEDADGNPIANAVAPGKRPRSSMSPTIALDENGDFLMAVGSPGGRNIISYVAKTIVGMLSWDLSPQEAINLANMVAKTERIRIERHRAKPEVIQALRDFGYEVYESEGEISGLSAIMKHEDGSLQGGADPRREGTVGILYDQ